MRPRHLPALIAVLLLAASLPAQAQLAPGKKITKAYKFPVGLKTYECCTPAEDPVLAPSSEASRPNPPVTRFPGDGALSGTGRNTSTCVDLSSLTPAERIRRDTTIFHGTCNRFAIYEHIVCSCENSCADVNTFICNCPGIPPGELPETGPQDSLGSQPELIGETCTPCNRLSSCEGF